MRIYYVLQYRKLRRGVLTFVGSPCTSPKNSKYVVYKATMHVGLLRVFTMIENPSFCIKVPQQHHLSSMLFRLRDLQEHNHFPSVYTKGLMCHLLLQWIFYGLGN